MVDIMQFPDYDFDNDQEIFSETLLKPSPIDCTNCKKKFFSKQNLELHQIFKHKILRYKCTKKNCSKSFLREEYLKEHIDMVHKGGKIEKPYKCDKSQKCIKKGTAFETEAKLKKHMTRHGEKTHFCDQCEMAFAIKGDLTAHLVKHKGEKTYQCRKCDESFTSTGSRSYHERKYH
jgi:KRAB domain-containing zinc finger protein